MYEMGEKVEKEGVRGGGMEGETRKEEEGGKGGGRRGEGREEERFRGKWNGG